MKKDKGSLLPIILLAASLPIFLATLLLTYKHVSKASYEQAEKYTTALGKGGSTRFSLDVRITEEMARSFLSSWFTFRDSLIAGGTVPPGYIADSELRRFKNEVPASMENFMRTSKSKAFYCEFVIVPGIYPENGDNFFAPIVTSDGEKCYDYGTKTDIGGIKSLRIMLQSESAHWFIHRESFEFHQQSLSYCIPLKRENGDVFGFFALNSKFDEIQKIFGSSLPYGKEKSAIIATGANSEILCTIGSEDLIQKSKPYIPDHLEASQRSDIFIFKTELARCPWDIYTVCDSDAVFEQARKTSLIVSTISVAGLFLIFLLISATVMIMRKDLKEKAQAESDIRLAADVQRKMLKAPEISAPGYQMKAWLKPALEAGGDLYDYVAKEGKLIFIVGDVSGKGLAASLFMAQVCSLFRSIAASDDNPCHIVSGINSVLAEDNATMNFCTLIVGTLDLSTGETRLCNAGHTRPVIIKDGKSSLLALTPNLPVAVEKDNKYSNDTVKLAPGEGLLLYTDGVNEARNPAHALFGEQRLINSLCTGGFQDFSALLKDISDFTDGEAQSDDITLLSIKYTASQA